METNLFKSVPAYKPEQGLNIVRIAIALILIVHAIHGLINPGDITELGEALSADGFPLGVVLAWSIVLFQFIGCIALIFGRLVVPACICNIAVLIAGVFYVHLHNGWFCCWRRQKWHRIQRYTNSLPRCNSMGILAAKTIIH